MTSATNPKRSILVQDVEGEPRKCSICGGEIDIHPGSNWDRGHNAQPINTGRCCSACNNQYVIPARLARMQKGLGPY